VGATFIDPAAERGPDALVPFYAEKFNQGRSKFVCNIVTGDETWIYAYDPETKQQSTV
jgi:hypothetical protein